MRIMWAVVNGGVCGAGGGARRERAGKEREGGGGDVGEWAQGRQECERKQEWGRGATLVAG